MCFSWRETANILPDASASAYSLCRSIRLMRTLPITVPSAALLAISYPESSPLLAVLIILTSLFAGHEASAYRQLNSCWRILPQCEMVRRPPIRPIWRVPQSGAELSTCRATRITYVDLVLLVNSDTTALDQTATLDWERKVFGKLLSFL